MFASAPSICQLDGRVKTPHHHAEPPRRKVLDTLTAIEHDGIERRMGILFCQAAVLCFTAFYLLVGYSQKRKTDPIGLNLSTFVAATVLSVAAAGGVRASQFPP